MSPTDEAKPPPFTIDPSELDTLARGLHSEPHRILGAHRASLEGVMGVVIRAFHPEATEVTCSSLQDSPKAKPNPLHPVGRGLFATFLPGAAFPHHYRLHFHFADGASYDLVDPYSFLPTIGEHDLHFIGEGTHRELWKILGANPRTIDGVQGIGFAVWAPNATSVSLIGDFCHWDGRNYPMRSLGSSGVFEIFIPGLPIGTLYKFQLRTKDGRVISKADPYAQFCEHPPATASCVVSSEYVWQDEDWMTERATRSARSLPMSTYEVHLGSWARVPEEGNRRLSYREIAPRLIAHLKRFSFTHVELMGLAEHPFDGSWGYQVTGYYAPTSRFGTPDDFRFLIDECHRNEISVIMDWVPAHFPKDDFALRQFDGTPLYEHDDERRGEHPDWGTLIFNFGRNEVRNFLVANAVYWMKEFHIDGLRVDAVASMLYLDYSRKEGEWLANQYGGRENIEAIDFLRELNAVIAEECPGCITIAEESTSWAGVTAPTEHGGLGFTFKWNMGWMNDTLRYFAHNPVHRGYHQGELTFAMLYEYSEHFVMPLSHDEVVHRKGSLLGKMPGDHWQRLANLRLLLTYQYTRPGKNLLFMGTELAPDEEWNHDTSLPWHLWELDPLRRAFATFMEELGKLYLNTPALWKTDHDPAGFEWIDAGDHQNSVLSYIRRSDWETAVVTLNLTPVPRENYRIGVPYPGLYRERFSSDAPQFGGGEFETHHELETDPIPAHGRPHSLSLRLPPLGALILEKAPEDSAELETKTSSLHKLADHCGILRGYDGTDGHWHGTTDETRVQLLAAMGIDASNEAKATLELQALDHEESDRLMPSVRVVRQGSAEAEGFSVRLPGAEGTHRITWHLELEEESGVTHTLEGTDQPVHADLYLAIPNTDVLPPGYHELRLRICSGPSVTHAATQRYILTPRACPSPAELTDGRKVFGITTNLYTLRGDGNWGIGNLTDLKELIDHAADSGAAFVGINPLHALENRGEGISPYYPISRFHRNRLYLDVEAIPEFKHSKNAQALLASKSFQRKLARHRQAESIDYPAIAALQKEVLILLYAEFRVGLDAKSERRRAYDAFVKGGGDSLLNFATFEALRAHFEGLAGGGADWRNWPDDYRDPTAPALLRFRREHHDEIDFHCYLQFELECQLTQAHQHAVARGLPIGILHDLALGNGPGGADAWGFANRFARGASIGAPPDPLAEHGQNWGLPPMNPLHLRKDGYRLWTNLLRHAFQSAGALRMDHAMGLERQFWIPDADKTSGAYVAYPWEDLVGILALESHRAGALVIGEDLGTVPPGFREKLEDWGIQRTQVLYFEGDGTGGFQAPEAYVPHAFTTANTHDLSTLTGYAHGADLLLRHGLGLVLEASLDEALQNRSHQLQRLREAFIASGALDETEPMDEPAELCAAASEFLAMTPSLLVGIALDDLGGEVEAVNVPGVSVSQHPSWSRRMKCTLGEIFQSKNTQDTLEKIRRLRPLSKNH